MRIRDAFICAALAAAPLQAQQAVTEADARAVVAAVLAHQVSIRGAEGAAETCVIDALDRPPAAPGVATEEDPLAPDHAVHIYFQWHVPDAPPPGRASAAPPQPAAAGGRRGRPASYPRRRQRRSTRPRPRSSTRCACRRRVPQRRRPRSRGSTKAWSPRRSI